VGSPTPILILFLAGRRYRHGHARSTRVSASADTSGHASQRVSGSLLCDRHQRRPQAPSNRCRSPQGVLHTGPSPRWSDGCRDAQEQPPFILGCACGSAQGAVREAEPFRQSKLTRAGSGNVDGGALVFSCMGLGLQRRLISNGRGRKRSAMSPQGWLAEGAREAADPKRLTENRERLESHVKRIQCQKRYDPDGGRPYCEESNAKEGPERMPERPGASRPKRHATPRTPREGHPGGIHGGDSHASNCPPAG
jgi:hypothetical protein